MTHEWTIQGRADQCAHSQRTFADGEFFYAVLFRGRDGTLSRRDYSEPAWRELRPRLLAGGPAEPAGGAALFSFWRSRFLLPPPAPAEPLARENAEALLRRLLREAPPPASEGSGASTAPGAARTRAHACYVLALMLERKRVLRPVKSPRPAGPGQASGGAAAVPVSAPPDQAGAEPRLLCYEHAKTGELFVVADPGLRLDQLEPVQREVADLLTAAVATVNPGTSPGGGGSPGVGRPETVSAVAGTGTGGTPAGP